MPRVKEKEMNDKIKQLIKISEENPDLEIITMVSYELCADDCHQYWTGSIGDTLITEVYYDGDGCAIMGEDNIKDELEYIYSDYVCIARRYRFCEYIRGMNEYNNIHAMMKDFNIPYRTMEADEKSFNPHIDKV